MSILSMLLNPISVPKPTKVRKVIDGIEVKPPRHKSEELPKAITGRFASRSAQIRHEVIKRMKSGKTYTVMSMMKEVDASKTAVSNALEWLVDNSLADRQRGEGRYDYVEYFMPKLEKPPVKKKNHKGSIYLIERNRILHEQTFAKYKSAAGADWINTPDLQRALKMSNDSVIQELKNWHANGEIERRPLKGHENAKRPRYEWRFK